MADILADFADWYLSEPKLRVAPPFLKGVSFVEGVVGCVLHREAPFQVQLFIMKPDTIIPEHCHPNVDSFEVYLGGDIQFSLCGELLLPFKIEDTIVNGISTHMGWKVRVYPQDKHGATCGEHGGSFLSIQHWLNNVPPTTVGEDWEGNTMGPEHNKLTGNL